MRLPFAPPLAPMLSSAADALPGGEGWQFEPKWDGFRTLVFRDGDEILLQSRDENDGDDLSKLFCSYRPGKYARQYEPAARAAVMGRPDRGSEPTRTRLCLQPRARQPAEPLRHGQRGSSRDPDRRPGSRTGLAWGTAIAPDAHISHLKRPPSAWSAMFARFGQATAGYDPFEIFVDIIRTGLGW